MNLHGVGVALVTPFDTEFNIDFTALENLIQHTIKNGVNYIVLMGTTGETPTLNADEKSKLLNTAIEMINKKVPLVLGLGANNTSSLEQQIETHNSNTNIDAYLSVTPYYNKPSQEGLYQHYSKVATASKKPIIMYNVPGRTGVNMTAATTLRLANAYKNIIGIKEASSNFDQIMTIINHAPQHFDVISGDDNLTFPSIALGMKGVISVAANCFTKDFCNMVSLALNQDYTKARELHYKLLHCINLLFKEGNPAGVKFVLSKMGIMKNMLRLPLVPISEDLETEIETELIQIL